MTDKEILLKAAGIINRLSTPHFPQETAIIIYLKTLAAEITIDSHTEYECPICKERDTYEKEQVIKDAARKIAETIDAEILAYIPRGSAVDIRNAHQSIPTSSRMYK